MKLNVLKIEKIIDGENKVIFPVLIQNENRNYLVDCGYEETFEELKSELESFGIGINDLTGVIITHDDYDHLGSLKLLKKDNVNLKIYCGEYEKDSVSGITKSERLIQAESTLDDMPTEYKDWSINFIQKLKNVQRVSVDKELVDMEYFERDIIVIHTPGHTKGHISLFYPKTKILIAGDSLVIENEEFNIANPSFTLDIKSAIKSVEKIKGLNPHTIICYHGGIMDRDINNKLTELIDKYKNYTQHFVISNGR
ncbi:MBL fold metallo-hydrolase [Mariniphaga sediminis]|uniref:MBL fold metallo-hydrolase n=1 Tax=Mariniphaga sediminis TaxID=1628158 RepID=A0A399D632_9BACT|nr:MBL fold metallo-hydrolase [Mariniphaga sediminis]RIH66668.1 MBL fold metallo-hydrolase [Mariniphaga sediminis]